MELAEITYQANRWNTARRIVVVRQSVKRKNAPGKTRSLFADDPDIQGWRYGAMATNLSLPAVEVWRSYRGRADCENRIKELKNDFRLDSFNLNSFYATEAALDFAMLAYNLMSTFRQAVMHAKIQPTLTTLHQQVLAVGAFWHRDPNQNKLLLAVSRRRRAWFEGLWANAGYPPVLPVQVKIG
ncbi:MAG: Transposase DDE domain group 1 [Candidatus Nitrotoga sp. LAW]|nr:MAG: Transposase DDE domain group 1 [Candidatus Nitrotoga sp. LAW]